jgi:hypothetical protein
MRLVPGLFVCAVVLSLDCAEAANRTVCSSGCQYTSVQAAIDAAVPGDTILLRAGQTFVGNYILRNKNTTSTQFITIRSDAADSNFPGPGVRLIPEGKSGWNTRRSALPRLVGVGGTGKSTPIFRTAAGAHHYRIQFVEIDGLANVGYETLVALGASTGQTSLSQVPRSIVIDRVWLHGHPTKGMKRGIYLNSASTDILNSYFEDFFSFSDSQAISGTNGPGPYRIFNNHLEAAGENIIFGGDDPKIENLVPSDIQIRANYMTKDLRWRNPILATPSRPSVASSSVASSLSSGTHYFKVAAVISAGGGYGYSAGSAEASITISAGRSVTLSWPAVAGADRYRIYRGRSSNSESVYLETTGTQTTFTYTGANERSGTPRTAGSKWTVKNLLELKNAQRVTLDGNIFEYNWAAGQHGYALLFSVRNQSGTAPWSVVRDVTFINNTVRHVAAGISILGRDYLHPSQQVRNLTIRNNIFEDLDNAYGNTGRFVSISQAPANVVIDHNTIDNEGTIVEVMDGDVTGFVFTNNIARHNTYGIKGQGTATGNSTLSAYFPSAVVRGNVLAGGNASAYPSGNYFPPTSEFLSQFLDPADGEWQLASTSTYNNRATDGTDIGANVAALELAQDSNSSGGIGSSGGGDGGDEGEEDEEEEPTDPPANQPPVANAGGPYSATAGTAITVNGGRSTDAEAPLVRYDWHFGEDVVLRATDVSAFGGTRFRRISLSGAAGGVAIENPNWGEAKRVTAYSNPRSYVEFTFEAGAGVPYWVWIRMRASGNSGRNDSLHVQFDRSVSSSGSAVYRIGTPSSIPVVLEGCDGAGVSGWGWNDGGWCGVGAPVYFQTAGRQRLRIQQREDGVTFDQIIISSNAYSGRAPGTLRSDTTIVPKTLGADTGITAVHGWRRRGTYPLRIWVTDSVGQEATASTTVTVR